MAFNSRAGIGGTLLCALTIAALGGCSVNTYKPAVDRFGTATQQAREAYLKMEATVLASHTESLRKQVLAGELRATLKPGTCNVRSESCEIVVVDRSGKARPLHDRFENINLLMGGIAEYAANLKAIVASDAPQQVTASFAAAGGSIKDLAINIAKINGSTPGGAVVLAQPSASVAGWVVGEFANLLQVDALRKATARADPVIQEALPILQESATAAADIVNAELAKRVANLREAHRQAPGDRGTLDRLESGVRDYNTALRATSPQVFTAMGAAHRDLADALAGKNITLTDAYAAIEQFARKAEELHKLITALEAAAKAAAAKK